MNYHSDVVSTNQGHPRGVICLLVVNKIPKMPEIAIKSILASTDKPVVVGFVDEADIEIFRGNPRISLIDLAPEFQKLDMKLQDDNYSGWTNDDFFKIVQLKWALIARLMEQGHKFILYSDLDVVWVADAFLEIENGFDSRPDISIQIQSFTRSINEPKLCMGFVAFRNDERARAFVKSGAERHLTGLLTNPRLGDDDVATLMNLEFGFPSWIFELPQTTYPVGVSLGLFRSWSKYPGLVAQEPYIFHANFVVGLTNKVLLMKIFLNKAGRKRIKEYLSASEVLILSAKFFRLAASRLRFK